MSADLKAKLAQVAARLAATQERLRGMERSAASLRQDLESLRADVARGASEEEPDDEWGQRIPTRPMALGGDGGPKRAVAKGEAGDAPAEAADAGAPEDEPWPAR